LEAPEIKNIYYYMLLVMASFGRANFYHKYKYFYLASERADSGTLPVLHHDGAVSLENDHLRAIFGFVRVIRLTRAPEGVFDCISIRAPLETRLVQP